MKWSLIISLLVLFVFLTPKAYASELNADEFVDSKVLEEGLGQFEKEITGQAVLDGSLDVKGIMHRLFNSVISLVKEKIKAELGHGIKLFSLGVLSALVVSINPEKKNIAYINIVVCASASIILTGQVDSMMKEATDLMLRLSDYSKAAMPTVFSAAALSGAPASSAAKYAAASLSIDILISLATRFIVPLINVYIALSVSKSIFVNPIISILSKFVKWLIISSMTLITMAFTTYISFTGLISGSVDAAAVKTTRTIIANSLPLIGKLISDASSVILAGASIIRNSAGAFCMIAVAALCAAPFVELMVKMLVYKAASAAVDMLPGTGLSALLNDLGTAYSMLMGLVGCCGIMLFVSFVSGMKVLI